MRNNKLRNTVLLVLAVVLLGAAALVYLQRLSAASTAEPTGAPTPSALPSGTPAPPPTGTPYPPPEEWSLEGELERWQQEKVIADVALFWELFMRPEGGLPNCQAASELMWSGNPTTREIVAGACDEYLAQGFYHRALPLHQLRTEFFLFPDESTIVVRLDTAGLWQRETRYTIDNQIAEIVTVPHTIYDVSVVLEDGRWAVAAMELHEAPED